MSDAHRAKRDPGAPGPAGEAPPAEELKRLVCEAVDTSKPALLRIARTIHAHPTMSEALKEAALAVSKSAIHAL